MIKKILHIDLDGVIFDFSKAIKQLAPHIDTKSFSKEVDTLCEANPYIFHELEPIEDAIPSAIELFDLFDVYFLSTPMWGVPLSFTGKRLSLEKHFGKMAEKKLILTHRKDLVIGDYIVDDTDRHGVSEFKGIHIHFGTEKFPDWKTTLTHLKQLA